MNPVAIVLGIIVIMLLYFIYITYFKRQTLSSKINLNTTPTTTIPSSTLTSPASASYAYGAWVFINTLPQTGTKLISTTDGNSVILQTTGNGLSCSFTTTANAQISNTIMSTIPLQMWTHIIVSINNNNLLDVYVNGKLYQSAILSGTVKTPSSSTGLTIGNGNALDIYMTKIMRWGYAMDPTTAWKTYLEGNGMNTFSYNLQMSVSEDNKVTSSYTLF